MKLKSPKQRLSLSKSKPIVDIESQEYLKFISDAEKIPQEVKDAEKKEEVFPWEEPNVRDDVVKIFNLRLSEKYYKKLEYLSKMRKESKHSICMSILLPEIDKLLNISK